MPKYEIEYSYRDGTGKRKRRTVAHNFKNAAEAQKSVNNMNKLDPSAKAKKKDRRAK